MMEEIQKRVKVREFITSYDLRGYDRFVYLGKDRSLVKGATRLTTAVPLRNSEILFLFSMITCFSHITLRKQEEFFI